MSLELPLLWVIRCPRKLVPKTYFQKTIPSGWCSCIIARLPWFVLIEIQLSNSVAMGSVIFFGEMVGRGDTGSAFQQQLEM